MTLGCGAGTSADWESEASNCPSRPLLELGAPRHLVALNAFFLQEEAARAVRSGQVPSPAVEEVFAKATALGVPVIRTWAFNDALEKSGDTAIQIGRLQYDEIALRGLDLVLARAFAHRIQLVLPLGNYWNDYGGAAQYVAWAGLAAPVQGDPRFFTERAVIDHYKEHLRRLLNRINTMDGVRYGDHPAVLAWELLNEPRNTGLDPQGDALRAWVDEIAAHLKSLASAKLIGTGEEGFEPAFQKNVASPHVDFGSIHYFPEGWNVSRDEVASTGARWIFEHGNQAREMGKPLLLGEFALRNQGSFTLPERRAMYRGWLRCARNTGIAGAAPWVFANDARPDGWDPHTFYFLDGSELADPRNRYADLIREAALAL